MNFKYCPYCKGDLIKRGFEFDCKNCDNKVYINPAPCVSVLPIKDGQVLLSVRKLPPYKGELDLIGGFMQPNETTEECAIRECKEETGLDIKIIKLFGTYPDKYGKVGSFTINIQYLVKIIDGKMKATDDISDLKWINIMDIPSIKLNSFKNTKVTLKDLFRSYSRESEN